MDVFDLVAKLSLDQSEYESGLTNASTTASNFGSGLKTAMGVGAVAVAGVTTAVVGVTSAFGSGISSLAEYTDHIDKQSQKMNMSAESYQEWSAVMEHCGTSIDSMQSSMKTLSTAVETGNDAFEKLGLSQEELASMDNEEIFSATITALQNVDDETERTYLASQLLGRGATELGALLNTSAEDTQEMKDRVQELGGVMSDDAIKAGASFQDSLQDMKTAFTGLKNSMLSDFLPSVTTVMDGLTEVFAGNSSEGIGLITDGITSFIDNLSDLIPEMSEVGGGIMTALIDALTSNLDSILTAGADVLQQLADSIISNLPTIVETASQILGKVVEGIIQSLPELVSAGLEIIENLANGIGEALPTLIPTIVDVVLQITQTLIDHLPDLIEAGLTIFLGLVEGITEAIPVIIEALPELIDSIINAMLESLPLIVDAYIQLMSCLTEAIPDIMDALLEALPEIIDTIVEYFTGDGLSQTLTAGFTMFMALVTALGKVATSLLSVLGTHISSWVSKISSSVGQVVSASASMFAGIVTGFVEKASEVLSSIKEKLTEWVNAIKTTVSEWKTAGQNLIAGLWSGISDKAQWLYSQITGLGSTVVSKVKSLFGISSPSKVFAEIGGYLAEGLGVGWENGIEEVNKTIGDDLKYEGEMDVSTNLTESVTTASTSTLTDQDINRIISGLQINFQNVTNIDGTTIKQESYKYTIERTTNETRAERVAQGGYF